VQNAKPGVGDVALILKHSVFRPGAPAFTTLIKSCGRAGAWEKACELYDAMKQRGVPANTITCSALINALGKSRQWERAIDVFTEMKQNGVEANIFTYSALISACAKGKRLDKALEMFEECVDAGVAPDAITYGAVISACEKGKRVDKALEIFDQMKNPKSEHTECNVITYNSLLGACERAGRHGDTMRVFAAMRNEGVRPDKVTFAAVIGATAGLGEFKKALDVFRNMTRDRVEPDITTAAAALVACAGGGFAEDANAIYKEFVGKKTTADRSEDGGRREKETGANGRQGGRAGGGDVKDQSSSCGSSSHVALVTNALAAFEKANAWRHAVDVIGATCDLKQTAKARAVAVAADAAAVTLAAAALHVKNAPPPVMTVAARIAAAAGATSHTKDAAGIAEAAATSATHAALIANLTASAGGIRCDLPPRAYVTLLSACERSGLFQRGMEVFAAARCAGVLHAERGRNGGRNGGNTTFEDDDADDVSVAVPGVAVPEPPTTTGSSVPFHEDPSSFERALRCASAGGCAREAREVLDAMRVTCPGGETAAARASALAACAAAAPGSAPGAALAVWRRIVLAVAAHAETHGLPAGTAPALQACALASMCAARDGDAALAVSVLGAVDDVFVRVAAAVTFATDDADSSSETTLDGVDDATIASAICSPSFRGASTSAFPFLVSFLRGADTTRREKFVACFVAMASAQKSLQEKCAVVLRDWATEGVVGAGEGVVAITETATKTSAERSAGSLSTNSQTVATPKVSVPSDSPAAGTVAKPTPSTPFSFASAAGGGRGGGGIGIGDSAGINNAASGVTKQSSGESKGGKGKAKKLLDPPLPIANGTKTHGVGVVNASTATAQSKPTATATATAKGWGKQLDDSANGTDKEKKPLVAASPAFTPATAARAAPFVPTGMKKEIDRELTAKSFEVFRALSIAAPAFTPKVPKADAPAFVPKAKSEER